MSRSTAFNPFHVLDKPADIIPEELASACRKVLKKELSTKLNGFAEVSKWLQSADDISVFRDDFVRLYCRSCALFVRLEKDILGLELSSGQTDPGAMSKTSKGHHPKREAVFEGCRPSDRPEMAWSCSRSLCICSRVRNVVENGIYYL